ncbi:hypothetical protein [Streptomyces nanshensis]|uniref:Uncharacterized protein n=1 Tax=Streptomyces nanshensis TaxID=518642 RepID=A0A1E7KYA0_9ACTN|nr:hypothetical protein [Streptomyces nanshensis]OEV08793.1 hypothetical protein AN218_25005 [Streptomyces nanshensis]
MRAERREETAAALREQLRAADAVIEPPDGLWERVRTPRPDDVTPVPSGKPGASRPGRRPLPMTVIAVAAAAVAFVVCGTWWLVSPSDGVGSVQGTAADGPSSSASAPGRSDPVRLRVHNVEKACRELRTLECALRVAKNPYKPYAAPDNSAARVWHGDVLTASCVVTDGQLVTDENGVSSRRWYRVERAAADGKGPRAEGWLPGVRTRNTKEVRLCSGAEKPHGQGS